MAFMVLYFMHMRRLAMDFKKEDVHDAFLVKYRSLGKITAAEKVVVVVLAVVFFLWSTRRAVFFKGWANWFHMSAVDDTSVAFMAVAVLFAVPMSSDNLQKRILSWSVVKHKMAWGMLLTFGGGLALGVASEACKLRLNPLYLVFPVCLSVTQACIFPASSSVIAIICDEGHVTTKDLLIPGIIVKFFCQIVNLAFINTLANYVFNLQTFPSWASACFSSAPSFGPIPH
ncbi:solute carrier family 13 member 2 isoform X6 [Rhipicephalus microplus]|uniref:solute carrier family 13 member 2 isoform X6 n=1 Tax=Rhipicephalus microplus TaxID=6941 RepID=UPI003F6C272D